jgi:two-component system chemotaxis response regulator CheB
MTVVIVDDSAVQRRFARAAIEADGRLTVIGEARNGRDAVAMVDRLRPQAVLMDLHLPVMNGIEAIERIMATRPTPIIVYSAFVDGDDRDNAAAALAAGAVDVMEKPSGGQPGQLEAYADALRRRLRVAGRVKVITHPRGRLGGSVANVSTRRLGGPAVDRPAVPRPVPPVRREGWAPRRTRVIAIGASTGGPQALSQLLAELPGDLEAAVVVVQHMADGFIEGLATWLDGVCALPVMVGANGRRLQPGTVTIAPSGLNLIVHDQLRVTTHEPPPTQYHVPGIDATFTSVSENFGSDAIGVLLTGMGRDGALGLKRMRERGSLTIGQDEESSAVYGMPAAAMALGAVEHQLPLVEIGPVLRQVAGRPGVEEGAS